MRAHEVNGQVSEQDKADIARAFEAAVVDTLVIKCRRALKQENLTRLVMAGGVSANVRLRAALEEKILAGRVHAWARHLHHLGCQPPLRPGHSLLNA